MALEDKLVLNLSFDEADGATKTYDYSSNRADGIVENAKFEAGKSNNCINFTGEGTCKVERSVLDISRAFTLATYVKLHEPASRIIVMLNYAGIGNIYSLSIDVNPETWYYLAVVRNGTHIDTYLNGALIENGVVSTSWGNPVGFSISEDNYATLLGNACIDETKLYQAALTQEEVLGLLDNTKQLAFYVDGINIKERFGVCVSKIKGIADSLKMKEPLKVDWDGYHGEQVDLSRPRFEARDITVECFIKTTGGKLAFMQAVHDFFELFNTPHTDYSQNGKNGDLMPRGLHRFMVDIHPTKPLVYEVYKEDNVEVEKEWNDKKMVGTFTLKLREPEPIKRVLKHLRINENSKQVTINLTTTKMVNVYWGDGTTTQDVSGTDVELTHDYQLNGEYFPVITGVVEDIAKFDTNAIIVWNKL